MQANEGIVVVERQLSQHGSFVQDPQVTNTDYNSESDSSELRIENLYEDFAGDNLITVTRRPARKDRSTDELKAWSSEQQRSRHQVSTKSNKVLESIKSNLNYLNLNM